MLGKGDQVYFQQPDNKIGEKFNWNLEEPSVALKNKGSFSFVWGSTNWCDHHALQISWKAQNFRWYGIRRDRWKI